MGINLQVVGIFYSVKLDAEEVKGATVKDVLEAAKKNPGEGKSFDYGSCFCTKDGKSLVKSFTAKYDKGFSSRVSNFSYKAGTYTLEQNLNTASPSYTVWQYYVLDENGKRVKLPEATASYTTNLDIKDGYSVIWRLISVLKGPTQISDAQTKLQAYS
ncbi:MAG: hypothetical protein AAF915_16420 [Cyanobacteria bacterium P01_D01_bin.50]